MKHHLLNYLICPESGGPLELKIQEEHQGQIKEGQLISPITGHVYPIRNYVPRFVSTEQYAGSFGNQREYVRRHFRHYRQDRSGFELFQSTTGLTREELSAGLVLEVGCGYGRFIDAVQQYGGEIVGVDLSTSSINLAQEFVGLRPRVHLVQCDLYKLPFKEKTFGFIYSIGVLHHTPNCRQAFELLSNYLTPNGRISIWVYHPRDQANVARWRQFTTGWSPNALYAWCIANQLCFSWIRMLPVIRWKFSRFVPGSPPGRGRHFWLRVLEDFDNLSPQYASTHTPDEVMAWFREAGLEEVRALHRLTAVTGRRPGLSTR